jgi:steroid 5-alpha reductase family enzyme
MSLKAFHIVFIAASVVLMLILCGWCIGNYRDEGRVMDLVWGALAFAAALGLVAYGRAVLKKLKHISFL